jgi:hypothetical protein
MQCMIQLTLISCLQNAFKTHTDDSENNPYKAKYKDRDVLVRTNTMYVIGNRPVNIA